MYVVWAILALRLLIPVQLTLTVPQAPGAGHAAHQLCGAERPDGVPAGRTSCYAKRQWVMGAHAGATLSAADTGNKTVDITDILLTPGWQA